MKRTLLMLVTLGLTPGCTEPYDSVLVTVSNPDADAHSSARRAVSVGGAATIRIRPVGRSEYSGTETITVDALDPRFAKIRHTILSDHWTVLGGFPGTASFVVFVDGARLDTFEFEVVEPSLSEGSGS